MEAKPTRGRMVGCMFRARSWREHGYTFPSDEKLLCSAVNYFLEGRHAGVDILVLPKRNILLCENSRQLRTADVLASCLTKGVHRLSSARSARLVNNSFVLSPCRNGQQHGQRERGARISDVESERLATDVRRVRMSDMDVRNYDRVLELQTGEATNIRNT